MYIIYKSSWQNHSLRNPSKIKPLGGQGVLFAFAVALNQSLIIFMLLNELTQPVSLTNRLMLLSTQTPNLMVVGDQVEHKTVVL